MARVPIIHISNTLIATVHEELIDRDALALQDDLCKAIERTGAHGVLIDLSVVETLDSFLGRLLHDIARQARLLGAETVVVGMQPPVAITLVELGLEMKGVRTALNVEKGMALLRQRVSEMRLNGRTRGR